MEDGYIMPGETCVYSVKCGAFAELACNGEGCPVANGKTINVKFSCAMARGFALCVEPLPKPPQAEGE